MGLSLGGLPPPQRLAGVVDDLHLGQTCTASCTVSAVAQMCFGCELWDFPLERCFEVQNGRRNSGKS